uniref:Ubiquitin-like protease family profile domain-containing protein n=1 Tax=Glossina palpalis gambiensis TaxID=67801 RepID=A0A1B0BYB0_9MUSC
MPLTEVPVPRRDNQIDCGVFLLLNLERYLRQRESSWDLRALPETWCTVAEARHARIAIAAVLLELAAKEKYTLK